MVSENQVSCFHGGLFWPEDFDHQLKRSLDLSENYAKIDVIIPAFNEQKSIAKVLNNIPQNYVRKVIVVDNASTDDTAKVAAKHGATVIYEPQKGYGSACLAGLRFLTKNPPDIVVFLDADFSDYPEQMPRLLSPIIHHNIDIVIGSRTLGQAQSGALLPHARLGNLLACTLLDYFWGYKFTDLGPFRAIKYNALLKLGMVDQDFGWTVEMQIKSASYGLSCVEVPVDYRPRIGTSKISGTLLGSFKAGKKILSLIAKQACQKYF